MKAKYLFYSLALASAFTACTQDELFDAPALENNEIASRPVAGIVTFVNEGVESRYNRQSADFETNDEMGIYLMDEFNGSGEEDNANETLWQWQSCWWKMYDMVNYISTNYKYVYNADTEEWVNRSSSLNEGNYIALFPQNERATNRRDLWHPIKGEVDMVNHTDKERYYVNRDNQFFVGYEQIMRDQNAEDAEGNLTADISMKPIMTYMKFQITNSSADDFKPTKIVFKLPGNQPLPNVAYIKPENMNRTMVANEKDLGYNLLGKYEKSVELPWWAFEASDAKTYIDNGKENACKDKLLAWSEYDRNSFTQAAARSLVQYHSTDNGEIPYGMTEKEAAPIYEYVFNYPKDVDILYGTANHTESNGTTDRVSTISIALPAFGFPGDNDETNESSYYWKNMQVVVYGEVKDPATEVFEPAIIRKWDWDENQNGTFNLDDFMLWETPDDIPVAYLEFDDGYVYRDTEIRVSNTEDLYTTINARLTNNKTNSNLINFNVTAYGNGLEITDDIMTLIRNYEAGKTKVDVVLTFKSSDTPIILKAADCMDEFIYNGVDVVLEADQTIDGINVEGINDLINYKNLTIKNEAGLVANGLIKNEVGASISIDNATLKVTNIRYGLHNEGTLTLNDATIEGKVTNEAVMTTEGVSSVDYITNDNNCINCGRDLATLTISEESLNVNEELINKDVVTVEAGAKLTAKKMSNNGSIVVNGEATFKDGKNNEGGIIDVNETGVIFMDSDRSGVYGVLTNNHGATINVKGSLTENIKNAGVINVIENGIVIVNGKPTGDTGLNGIIDISQANAGAPAQAARDMGGVNHNYFRYTVGTETTATALQEALKLRISSDNWGTTKNPIILVWGENSATSFAGTMTQANVERIEIENDLVIEAKVGTDVVVTKFGELNDNDWSNPANSPRAAVNKALWVKEGASLYVNAYATLELVEGADDAKKPLHVQVDGTFKANDQSLVKGKTVVVDGDSTGKVYVGNDPAAFEWNKGTFGGQWSGIE